MYRLLDEGKSRQAVSEILGLLESVATVFRGTGTSDGTLQVKYFNKIIGDDEIGQPGNGATADSRLDDETARLPVLADRRVRASRHGSQGRGCHSAE
ncbi:hypothetical protein [Rhizobium jaguaris]|uniref:hypothetical protein n=1 Tax=Rhizobium jaguaris TaxID=1312183 RepID=UPI0019690923|nr:hypothetical protein [Rhizobium jaguaris]